MSEKKKETEFRFLIPISEPPLIQRRKFSFYEDILREFVESNLKYAEVKEMGGRKPITVALTLRQKVKKRDIKNIRVLISKNKVYLERME
jgi:hypothetical protein